MFVSLCVRVSVRVCVWVGGCVCVRACVCGGYTDMTSHDEIDKVDF